MIPQPAFKFCCFALTITVLGLTSGCGSQPAYERQPVLTPQREASPQRLPLTVGEHAARIAVQQIGTPYRFGGNSRSGFDCSGLVQYSYSQAGKTIARTSGQQWSTTLPIAHKQLRAGDLLFFSIAGKMSHVGIYVGDQRFVHAPSTGRTVELESLASPFYARAFIRAGRPE